MFSLNTNNSIAKENYAYNEKVGISVFQSSNDKVYNNLIKSSDRGIFVAGRSSGNHIYNNTIMNGAVGLYFPYNNSVNNIYENNNLKNITQPIIGCVTYEFHTNLITVSCNANLSEIDKYCK